MRDVHRIRPWCQRRLRLSRRPRRQREGLIGRLGGSVGLSDRLLALGLLGLLALLRRPGRGWRRQREGLLAGDRGKQRSRPQRPARNRLGLLDILAQVLLDQRTLAGALGLFFLGSAAASVSRPHYPHCRPDSLRVVYHQSSPSGAAGGCIRICACCCCCIARIWSLRPLATVVRMCLA